MTIKYKCTLEAAVYHYNATKVCVAINMEGFCCLHQLYEHKLSDVTTMEDAHSPLHCTSDYKINYIFPNIYTMAQKPLPSFHLSLSMVCKVKM